jgi:hypothetical protein
LVSSSGKNQRVVREDRELAQDSHLESVV